ncbi:MAG TPA: VIT domain-containing protein [Polyangiaceae bacterium]|nr:VIT domain-containing protein [Polyangiaceae bacterium]
MNNDQSVFVRLSTFVSRALLAFALAGAGCHGKPKPHDATAERGRVVRVVAPSTGTGLQICAPQGTACAQAAVGAAVPAGSLLRTGAHSSAEIALADGSSLSLDHDSELQLAGGSRRARLSRGALVLDVPGKPGARAQLDMNDGALDIKAAKVALRVGSDFAIVDVVRGSATLSGSGGSPVRVGGGEEARLYKGSAPYVSSGATLAEAIAFSDDSPDESESGANARGLGELTARKPGSNEESRGAVKLATHRVRVRIAGAMARTEVDEIFENDSDDVLEGIYRFPIPTDAKIERLALEVDGKLEEGAFVDRDRAAAIWRGAIVNAAPSARPRIKDEIVWVPGPWRDPALLEWQRGGRFELKIFPIPKHGQRRIVLAYTEAVRPVGGVRHFSYALPVDPGGTTKIRHFDVDIELRGQDPKFGVRTLGYPLSASDRDGARVFSFSADDFTPNGDLSVEWALPERQSELSAFGYRAGDERYALLTLRPKLPRASDDRAHATAIVLDTSRSMFGEGLERAKRLTVRLARELDPAGPVTVLACDSTCRNLPAGFLTPGPQTAQAIEHFLSTIFAEGASDPTQAVALAEAALAKASENQVRDIVFIGDGTPTVGPIRAATITSAVRDALAAARTRITAVAVGSASDLDTLGALARAGGGVVLPYVPGQTLNEATLGVLRATYGSALRDVEVVLPEELHAVAPQKLDTILAGSETSISARMTSDKIVGKLTLRGKLGDTPFEQRYDLQISASENAGNAFVPRMYAAARIADLERNGGSEAKKEALALSTQFSVASRYSSLLVLESEAMFRAFGLDAAKQSAHFSAEELAEQSEAKAELPLEGAADGADLDSAALGALDKKSRSGGTDPRFDLRRPLAGVARGAAAPAAEAAPPSKAKAPAAASAAAAPAPIAGNDFAEPPPAPAPAAKPLARDEFEEPELPRSRPARRMIPMRRIWERQGKITSAEGGPHSAGITAVADAERALASEPDRRGNVRKAYSLYALSGDLSRASSLVDRWLSKEPLDPDALTARADLAARRGERELAVRMLGSVVDVRPDDIASQKRLARLYRWSGRAELGCRHAMAIAELRASDAKLLADALRCARDQSGSHWASDALSLVDEKTARLASSLSAAPGPDETRLLGDLRIEATWLDDVDLDLAILHPDGQRVSWLGAPTRELISARDVLVHGREGLALSGAKPGEYALEIVRSGGSSVAVRGELTVFAAGVTRRFPFTLDGQRLTIALAEIKMVPRLVPLEDVPAIASGPVR